jgi:hypothetical protein
MTKAKVIKRMISFGPRLHDLWNIFGYPLIARFDRPPSFTILPVRRIPTGLVPINNRQNARRMLAFRCDQNITSVEVTVDEADGVIGEAVTQRMDIVQWSV